MRNTYFWLGERVFSISKEVTTSYAKEHKLNNVFCVDMFRSHDDEKYGYFSIREGWVHIPYSMFPKEFKASLLLLT